jgi:prepilin-type N-terminal cleavage/methylation domain-containing protein
MRKLTAQRGFSLIELVMVIILVAVITLMMTRFLSQGIKSYLTAQNVTDSNWQGRIAMERMLRDIRQVRSPADVSVMTATEFAFVDILGDSIDYQLTGNTLTLNGFVLANGISSLTFAYYNSAGTVTTSATTLNLIFITLGVSQNNSNYSLTTSVYLRNMSL